MSEKYGSKPGEAREGILRGLVFTRQYVYENAGQDLGDCEPFPTPEHLVFSLLGAVNVLMKQINNTSGGKGPEILDELIRHWSKPKRIDVFRQ